MAEDSSKHVFVSYVKQDADTVDGLCAVLEAAQIPYWRDRKDLGPGDAWRAKIKSAIRDGSLVFLACFSENSRSRDKSYMNEELTLAVEEFRQMPPGRVWLIPVRLDDGAVPDWDLGAGRTLSDLNYSDLFGKEHAAHAARLVTTINRLLGDKRPNPATALAAVEQASAADRVTMLKQLTKDMLLETSRRIELDDTVSQEVQRVLAALKDNDRVASVGGTNEEQIFKIVEEAQEYWRLVAPFCASLQVAARWGSTEQLNPWSSGIRSFVAAALKIAGGNAALLSMRHLPGVVSIMTAALATGSNGNFENLKALVYDPTVKDRYEQKPSSILEATDPYKPFSDSNDWIANVLARATKTGETLEEALKHFTEKRQGKYYAPAAEWMHSSLRPIFEDQWPDDDTFDAEFDRAEVMLGVLAQDFISVRKAANPEGRYWGHSRWFGRSTYRVNHSHGNPVEDLRYEIETNGVQWAPLKAGMFGGEVGRARTAVQEYEDTFSKVARSRW